MVVNSSSRVGDLGKIINDLAPLVQELIGLFFDTVAVESLEIRKATSTDTRTSPVVESSDGEFCINLELGQCPPEEVQIVSENHFVTVTAQQDVEQGRQGYVPLDICRVYVLPEEADPSTLTSTMDSNGKLVIRARRTGTYQASPSGQS
jgi:HSP20 family molecular chaperone IbpA